MSKDLITKEEFEKISHLSRINITDVEEETILKKAEKIVTMLSLIQEVDTTNISPTVSVTIGNLDMRPDQDILQNSDDILKNAPNHAYNCYIVPKVVE